MRFQTTTRFMAIIVIVLAALGGLAGQALSIRAAPPVGSGQAVVGPSNLADIACPSSSVCYAVGTRITIDANFNETDQGVLVPIDNGVAAPPQVVPESNHLPLSNLVFRVAELSGGNPASRHRRAAFGSGHDRGAHQRRAGARRLLHTAVRDRPGQAGAL